MKKILLPLLLLATVFQFASAQFSSPVTTLIGAFGYSAKLETTSTTVTLTLVGPNDRYLGVGFGGTSMGSTTDAFIWNSAGTRDYVVAGRGTPSADGVQDWTVVSDVVATGVRTVVAKRSLTGTAADQDFAFSNSAGTIPIIYAVGSAGATGLSIHNTRGASSFTMSDCAASSIPLAMTNMTVTQNIVAGNNFATEGCSSILANVQPTGGASGIAGLTTSKVWIEATQPTSPNGQFVKRHYEITPSSNASSATGIVTLYFTQQEFNDFNAVSTVDLPTGINDNIGIANLRIEKRGGLSSDGSGLPGTYSGAVQTIDPNDLDIFFNDGALRWEISFPVTGFSGFFVKTRLNALPIKLINFSLVKKSSNNELHWYFENSSDLSGLELQASGDGSGFTTIYRLTANQTKASYQDQVLSHKYYRLKMIDQSGAVTYSKVLNAAAQKLNEQVQVYPTPASSTIQVRILNASLLGSNVRLLDMRGALLQQVRIQSFQQNIDVSSLAAGLYMLQFEDGSLMKVTKQ